MSGNERFVIQTKAKQIYNFIELLPYHICYYWGSGWGQHLHFYFLLKQENGVRENSNPDDKSHELFRKAAKFFLQYTMKACAHNSLVNSLRNILHSDQLIAHVDCTEDSKIFIFINDIYLTHIIISYYSHVSRNWNTYIHWCFCFKLEIGMPNWITFAMKSEMMLKTTRYIGEGSVSSSHMVDKA